MSVRRQPQPDLSPVAEHDLAEALLTQANRGERRQRLQNQASPAPHRQNAVELAPSRRRQPTLGQDSRLVGYVQYWQRSGGQCLM